VVVAVEAVVFLVSHARGVTGVAELVTVEVRGLDAVVGHFVGVLVGGVAIRRDLRVLPGCPGAVDRVLELEECGV